MILAKINVTKIDKTRLFDGRNGKVLDFVLIETPDNEYGNDFLIVQSVTKEERESGKKGNILGNGKYAGGGKGKMPEPVNQTVKDQDSDVPF